MSEIFSRISKNIARTDTRSGFEINTNRSSNRLDSENTSMNESFSGVVTSFTVYKLLSELVKSFMQLEAYKAGLIDANGNFTKPESTYTRKDKQILTPFNRLVIGIKRLIKASGSSQLKADYGFIQTAARAMAFECKQIGGDADLFLEELEANLNTLMEEGEIGNVVGAGIAGGGADPQPQNTALAGRDIPMGMPLLTRFKRKSAKERLKNVITEP
jgi:hypothetical protein